ncbi:MAG: type II secretion system secretin GspD [Candidatus Rokubacteria bacterium]|nr:type II secretion system secretin GspD [Candidatus Rokubacteria bacterium]
MRPPEPAPAPPPPPPPAIPPAPPTPGTPAAANIVFNFDNADVEVVIQAAAEIVGFNYVLAPAVRGKKVTVQTIGRIAADDVFNVLLTILDVNGLTAVRSGNLYRIIAREGAPQSSVRIVVGRDINPLRASDEILTQIVPLKYISAADAVNLLRPFVAQQGAVTSHRETNLLIITDTAANIRRLLDILKLADVQVALDELQVIPIKYADAQELSVLLNQMFSTGRLRTGAAALGLPVAPPGPPGAPATPRPGGTAAGTDAGQGADRPPLIVAERRSNSLVIHARKQELETIFQLIAKLDADIYGGQRVFIYFVEHSKAKDLTATLEAIYGRAAAQGTRSPGAPPGSLPPGTQPPRTSQAPPALPIATPPLGGAGALDGEGGQAMSDLRFIADEVTNAIIVTTHPRRWKDIVETIKTLDRLARQVLIEVLVAEVVLTDDTKLGIEWAVRNGRFVFTNTASGVVASRPDPGLIPGAGSLGGGVVPVGFNIFTFAANEFIAALNALATENKVNVLSNPSIITSENKKAVINVSTSVPIVTSQQVPVSAGGGTTNSITQTVEYKDAGIILTVTPRIGEHGTVALEVRQEVNDVGANEPPPINSPRFTKREVETSVVLLNNQTLVLGGLIQSRRSLILSGLPFLRRIPVLGYLFGSTEEKIEKTELLLLITPRVIGTAIDAARLTEQMRNVTPGLEQSFKLAPPRPPATGTPPPTPPPAR